MEDGAAEGTTVLQLQLDTDVRRSAERTWNRAMDVCWRRFGRWCERDIPNNWLR